MAKEGMRMMEKTSVIFFLIFNSSEFFSPVILLCLSAECKFLRSLGEANNTLALWASSKCHGLKEGCLVELDN